VEAKQVAPQSVISRCFIVLSTPSNFQLANFRISFTFAPSKKGTFDKEPLKIISKQIHQRYFSRIKIV
jgi:hypothetical protein